MLSCHHTSSFSDFSLAERFLTLLWACLCFSFSCAVSFSRHSLSHFRRRITDWASVKSQLTQCNLENKINHCTMLLSEHIIEQEFKQNIVLLCVFFPVIYLCTPSHLILCKTTILKGGICILR